MLDFGILSANNVNMLGNWIMVVPIDDEKKGTSIQTKLVMKIFAMDENIPKQFCVLLMPCWLW